MNTKLLFMFLLISGMASAQTPPGYTKINARYDWIAGKFDSSLHIPGYATTPNARTGAWVGAGNVGIDTVGHLFYFYSGGSWRSVSPNITASNGLTKVGNDIKLGGRLTGATTISGANSNGVTLDSLNSLAASVYGGGDINLFAVNGGATHYTNNIQDGNTHQLTADLDQGQLYVGYDSVKLKSVNGLSFYTGAVTPTQRMVIDGSGNVGIGTGTPGYKLHVTGQASVSDSLHVDNIVSTGDSLMFRAKQGQSFYTAGVNRMVIDNSGNVGIGSAPDSANLKTGSFSAGYVKVSANNYLVVQSDYTVSVDNGANNWTVYLPTAAGNPGRIITVKRYDNTSSGTVTIRATGGNVQANSGSFGSTVTLGAIFFYDASIMFQSNGTNWEFIK